MRVLLSPCHGKTALFLWIQSIQLDAHTICLGQLRNIAKLRDSRWGPSGQPGPSGTADRETFQLPE